MTTRARRAILRRGFLVAGVVIAVVFALWQRAELYRVSAVDFAQRQRRESAWTGRRQVELVEYIQGKTAGHLLRCDGLAWTDLYRGVAVDGEYRFFLPTQPPLNEISDHLDDSFTYVALEYEGKTTYLDVVPVRPGDSTSAPVSLRYPLRRFALVVFLLGLLGYIFVPWPKRDPDVVAYARFIGAVLPDWGIGMLFIGGFFALPWFIVPGAARTSHPLVLDGGWIILTLVMWGFCLFGLAVHGVAAWYEASCIRVAGDHLRIESIRGVEDIPFNDIERLTYGVKGPPRALLKMGLLLSLLTGRATGSAMLAASREDRVIFLAMRDGRRRTFSLTGIYHVERLAIALQEAGVPVDRDAPR